jgi:tetratricopeptide (TPR) repeat protein
LAEALAETALAFHLGNNQAEAGTYFTRALDTVARMEVPLTSRFHDVTARVYLELGDLTQAEIAVQRAIESAEASGMTLDKARSGRIAGRLRLLQERHAEAIPTLRSALDYSIRAKQKVLELEIKALLALASVSTELLEATRLLTCVQAEMSDLSLPWIKAICAETRKRVQTPRENVFVISDRELPTLGEGASRMKIWSWKQAVRKADGDTSEAAKIMDVSVSYIRKLGQSIREGRSSLKIAEKKGAARTKQKRS